MNEKIKLPLVAGISFLIGLVIGGAIIFFTYGKKASANISLYPPKSSQVGSEWLVKIDGYAISKKDFDEAYKYLISQIPEQQRINLPNESLIKYQVLETLISQYVLVVKALNSGIYNSEENKMLINYAVRESIYKVYLNSAIKDPAVFKPTKAQIEEFYVQNKDQFEKLGWKADQIKMYAEQQIYNKNLQEWMAKFVTSTKEEFKIEKNSNLMEKLGIPSTPPAVNPQGLEPVK